MKRFGRNQRRALRGELAAERATRLHGCAPAPIGTTLVEDLDVITWRLEIDDTERMVERKAAVLVSNGTRVIRAYRADAPVSFQGGLYRITDIRYPERSGGGFMGSTFWQGGPDAFWLDLVGVVR